MLRARGGRARGPLKTRFVAVDDSETIPRRAYTYALPPPLLPRPQPTLISPRPAADAVTCCRPSSYILSLFAITIYAICPVSH